MPSSNEARRKIVLTLSIMGMLAILGSTLSSALVAFAFGSYPGHLRWSVPADINQDDIVYLKDKALIAVNFGKSYS